MGWSGRAPAPPAIEAGKGRQDKEHAMSQTQNATIAVVGIDISKNSFHIVGHDERGAIVLRQKWSRGQVEARLANMPPCLIGMEACVGAHHLSRKLRALVHDARLMPTKYVRPYSKGQKNDFRDAEAIAEAVQRPTMKFVATKTADQLDLQALHRVRERLVSQRTGIINQIRAFLLERGIAVRQGQPFPPARFAPHLAPPDHSRQVIQGWQLLPAGSVRAGGVGRADQAEDLGAPWAQALDRGGQEAAASQRAGDRTRQQARPHRLERPGPWPGIRGPEDGSGSEPIRLIPIPRQRQQRPKNEEAAMT